MNNLEWHDYPQGSTLVEGKRKVIATIRRGDGVNRGFIATLYKGEFTPKRQTVRAFRTLVGAKLNVERIIEQLPEYKEQ